MTTRTSPDPSDDVGPDRDGPDRDGSDRDGPARLRIGARVSCEDGDCGRVAQVVIDPVAHAVTHLVVEPRRRGDQDRLVPLSLLDPRSDELRLPCPMEDFQRLPAAEETHFLHTDDRYADYSADQARIWPYYGLGLGGGFDAGRALTTGPLTEAVVRDALPAHEVGVHRGDRVHAVDGEIGRVQGIVVAGAAHHVTHVLLQEGHLFGRREVAIPIDDVTSATTGIELRLSKKEVEDLPLVGARLPAG